MINNNTKEIFNLWYDYLKESKRYEEFCKFRQEFEYHINNYGASKRFTLKCPHPEMRQLYKLWGNIYSDDNNFEQWWNDHKEEIEIAYEDWHCYCERLKAEYRLENGLPDMIEAFNPVEWAQQFIEEIGIKTSNHIKEIGNEPTWLEFKKKLLDQLKCRSSESYTRCRKNEYNYLYLRINENDLTRRTAGAPFDPEL